MLSCVVGDAGVRHGKSSSGKCGPLKLTLNEVISWSGALVQALQRHSRFGFVALFGTQLVLLLWLPNLANGQLPRIRLTSVFPPAVSVGATQTASIAGELSEAATGLVFSHAGIRADQQIVGPTEFTATHRKPRQFDIHIDDGVPEGRYDLRAIGAAGLSAPRTLVVTRLKTKVFDASGNSRQSPSEIAVGEMVSARGRNDQRDWYRFSAKTGQRLLIQLWAERIDSRFDGVLSVYSARSGRRLVHFRQGITRDPVLSFLPPEDGEYLIEVRDSTYRGGDEYSYVLELSQRPYVDAIHPAVAKPGVSQSFQLYGHNLPGGQPVSGTRSGLQSLAVTFAPEFLDGQFARALSLGSVAASRLRGGAVPLPTPLAGSVFMGRTDEDVSGVTLETGENNLPSAAQEITLPADVAGQFYPRRDVDSFRFDAKKGQTLWLEVATQQLGTTCDPIMRVYRHVMENDEARFQQVATADDMDGTPNSRDKRRFHTGTTDAELRFRVPEDGTYVVSVSDQYNTSNDDPRLVYRLSVRAPKPDFQLVAFANPERHGDDKIVKPNGVALLPGGSATIRVRVLPRHGFNGAVHVEVSSLPQGIVAYPLRLDSRQPEGLLVLTASPDANPIESAITIVGKASMGNARQKRVARIGAIKRSVNNVDAEPAKARLTDELQVAVLPAPKSPIVFNATSELRSSRGAKLTVPLSFSRDEDWKDKEIEVSGSAPGGVKLTSIKTKTDVANVVATFSDGKLRAGRHTLSLSARIKEKRARNVTAIREAEADVARISEAIAARAAALKTEEEKASALATAIGALAAKYEAEKQQTQEPVNKLRSKLQEQQLAAKELDAAIQKAINDPGNAVLSTAVTEAESRLNTLGDARKRLQESLGDSLAPLTALSAELATRRGEEAELRKQMGAVRSRRDEALKKKQEAEKRLADVRKNEEKEVEYWIYAPPVEVVLRNSPVTLKTTDRDVALRESFEIPVLVERAFGFDGQLTLKCVFPADSGLHASPVVLGPGQRIARIQVSASEKAKSGAWNGEIQSRLNFNNLQIEEKLPCKIVVAEPKE